MVPIFGRRKALVTGKEGNDELNPRTIPKNVHSTVEKISGDFLLEGFLRPFFDLTSFLNLLFLQSKISLNFIRNETDEIILKAQRWFKTNIPTL